MTPQQYLTAADYLQSYRIILAAIAGTTGLQSSALDKSLDELHELRAALMVQATKRSRRRQAP